MDTLRVLFAFRQQDGAAPRKLKIKTFSNHKMPMSTNRIKMLCKKHVKKSLAHARAHLYQRLRHV